MAVGSTFREPQLSVPLVLPAGLLARINRLATERGITRSALIREAINQALFPDLAANASSARGSGKPHAQVS